MQNIESSKTPHKTPHEQRPPEAAKRSSTPPPQLEQILDQTPTPPPTANESIPEDTGQ
jgi:hypothetical protein